MNRGNKADISVPAEIEFAAMFVPSCARAKALEMTKTPNRWPESARSRNLPRRSSGFQTGSSYRTPELEDTIIPMKEVIAKPIGIVNSCDQSASVGLRATRAKSEALRMRAAKLAIEVMMPLITAHASSLPWTVAP